MVFVGRSDVFTRAGRLCILLYNCVKNLVILRRECSTVWLYCCAQRVYVRSVQQKLLRLFMYASSRTTDSGASPLSVQPVNIPRR